MDAAFSLADPTKVIKRLWTREDEAHLMELVQEFGAQENWPRIALVLNRRAKECRARYLNHLDPYLKTSSWTHDEDAVIKRIHTLLGARWSTLQKYLPGRSEKAIRNRHAIISRDNYSDHDVHGALKIAFQLDATARTNVGRSISVREPLAIRLERFRVARDLMDHKISLLLLDPELQIPTETVIKESEIVLVVNLVPDERVKSTKIVHVDPASEAATFVGTTSLNQLNKSLNKSHSNSHNNSFSSKRGPRFTEYTSASDSDSDSDNETCLTTTSRSPDGVNDDIESVCDSLTSPISLSALTRAFHSPPLTV